MVAYGSCLADETYLFRRLDTTVGLPDNEMSTATTMADGRVCVRTASSLSFFDGSEFKSFHIKGTTNYRLNYVGAISKIYADADDRIWNKETGRLLLFDKRIERFIDNIDSTLQKMGVRGKIDNLFIDRYRGIWFVMHSGGLVYREANGRLHTFKVPTKGLRDICLVGNNVWMAYASGQVWGWNLKTGKTISRRQLWLLPSSSRDFVAFSSAGNDLWIHWSWGCARYDATSRQWLTIATPVGSQIVAIAARGDGKAYLSLRHNGLWLVDNHTRGLTHINAAFDDGLPSGTDIQDIVYNHANGNLFLTYFSDGMAFYNPSTRKFPFVSLAQYRGYKDETFKLSAYGRNKILITSSRHLLVYDTETHRLAPLSAQGPWHELIAAHIDKQGRIWIGTFRNGFYLIDGSKTAHFMLGENAQQDINYNTVRGFATSKDGQTIVSFHGSVGYFDEHTGKVTPLPDNTGQFKALKMAITWGIDKSNRLWISSERGFLVYDLTKKQVCPIDRLITDPEKRDQLSGQTKVITIDSRGLAWVGKQDGLFAIDTRTWQVYALGAKDGLPNQMILGIAEDHRKAMWVTTAYGLCRIIPEKTADQGWTFKLTAFDANNKLADSRFLSGALAVAANGHVVAGCRGGFYDIGPNQIAAIRYDGRPMITSLYINNEEVRPGRPLNGHIILTDAIEYAREITLRHNENFVTLHFSGLNFGMPMHTEYRYRLEGVDKQWVKTTPKDGVGIATYTDLSPGTYTFQLQSAGTDGSIASHTTKLTIVVEPPLWLTWWAKLGYMLALMAIVGYGMMWRAKRNRERMEQEKYREVEEMKYRFFTNISHEFRTLLTLIITPLGSVMKRATDSDTRSQLNIISKNAGDLLQLVNELLDFRQIETSGAQLRLQSGSIDEFVAYTVAKFNPVTDQKNILTAFHNYAGSLFMLFDRDKLGKVLTNLLSNAYKYTNEGGRVDIDLKRTEVAGQPWVSISVSDTGVGIDEEAQKHVFERFYRAENHGQTAIGSGIGLNVAAEYVKLMGGNIGVESTPGKGSTFTVALPIALQALAAEPNSADNDMPEPPHPTSKHAEKTVLVVEDNHEFRHFMATELASHYHILTAADGQEGYEKAAEKSPDLIVSDVMMPRMSGTEMCKRLKEDLQTSHIPIVLLTAWSNDATRAEGYKAGADGYIAKPFDMDVLLARIDNLLERQDQRLAAFAHNASTDPKTIAISPRDEEFLDKAIQSIERHLDDSDYQIDALAADVALSRMSLYRKMKAQTGQTPADFIRTIRMKRAAQMLAAGEGNVQEVCWRTGFASTQNFTRRFKEMFGVLPSQYGKQR